MNEINRCEARLDKSRQQDNDRKTAQALVTHLGKKSDNEKKATARIRTGDLLFTRQAL